MADKKINIELTNDEAIVLFEFLCRFNKNDDLSRFEDLSEQRVLWDIESVLEKKLSEPFREDYQKILKKARESVLNEK